MAPLKRFPMIHLCNKYYSNSRYQMVSLIREFEIMWNSEGDRSSMFSEG